MGHRAAKGLALVALIAGMAAPAHADFNIATGLKWVPLRYTFPVGVGTEECCTNVPNTLTNTKSVPGQWYGGPSSSMYGWQSTSLDNYIAFFFTEQIGLQLSLDFGWGSHNNDTAANNTTFNFNTSYLQFGIGIGGKFYLNRPTAQRVSPYILVNFFKYFATVSSNDPLVTNDIVTAIAAFHAPIGFDLAFGAEYFFTTSFSIGAEVLGLRFAHVGATFNQPAMGVPSVQASVSENYFTLYTGISLNYRFLATASVRTYEEEEDRQNPRPVRRKRRPPPPPVDEGGDTGEAPPPPVD
jgi:hypothetical protein